MWTEATCDCDTITPIIVDVRGDGYALTSAADGIAFDIIPGGTPETISWTSANSDDALLVMDRNGDGIINDGSELFGNYTPQPDSPTKNGFEALAVLDRGEAGGNGDGLISIADAAFNALQLWTDRNHDGVSQGWELRRLSAASEIDLAYKRSKHVDAHGNAFRYRSHLKDGRKTRWVYDVILVRWRDAWSTSR